MSLNWKEIDLILEELDLEGSFIQQVKQPVHSRLVFELHKPGRSISLLICLEAGCCRLHSIRRKIGNPNRPQRFTSFLRARVRGGRILSATQVARERIIKLDVSRGSEHTLLWIRLWSGAANLIATDLSGQVLDACYRRTKRAEISGGHYSPDEELSRQQRTNRSTKEYSVRDLPGDGDFNSRVDAYYNAKFHAEEDAKLRARAEQVLETRSAYFIETLHSLEDTLENNRHYQRYKELGDILMSVIGQVPEGETWLKVPDFYNADREVEIELNGELSLRENAQAYYNKYRKGRRQTEETTERIAALRQKIEELERQRKLVEEGNDLELLRSLAAEREKKQLPAAEKKVPGLVYMSGTYKIHIGRNATENDQLLRHFVRGNDYWFHSRDFSGGYVFVKTMPGKSLPLEVMLDAGNLAIFYSRARSSGKGDIYYTQVKYLRRPRQGRKGLVLPTQEKNLHILLDSGRIEKLKKNQEQY